MSSKLSQTAILVALSVTTWAARRYDNTASETVANHHHSKRDMGRYNKCLIDTKAPEFVAVQQAATALREFHYANTLAWIQKGACLLPAAQNFDYSAGVTALGTAFENAVEELVSAYPRLKAKAKKDLNGLYVEAEYPSQEELESKYGYEVIKFPVPDADDFRAMVSPAEADRIKAQITAAVEKAQHEAMRDLWSRLHKAVKAMADSLGTKDKRFHDTLVTNVRDIATLLPKLNVTNDPVLTSAGKSVLQHLTVIEPDDLRKNEKDRAATAKKAAELAAKMAGYAKVA